MPEDSKQDARPITKSEASRRSLSGGMLLAIVMTTLSVVGSAFTMGSKWGSNDSGQEAQDARLHELDLKTAANRADINSLAVRVSEFELKQMSERYTAGQASADWAKQTEMNATLRESSAAIKAALESMDGRTKRIEAKIDAISK